MRPIHLSTLLLALTVLVSGCVAVQAALQLQQLAQQQVEHGPVGSSQPAEQLGTTASPGPQALGTVSHDEAHPLFSMLRFVPADPLYRPYLTLGDVSAWHTATGVPRVESLADVEQLEPAQRNGWRFALFKQTHPPQTLGLEYLAVEEMRDFYGFGFFDADRYLEAGAPPDTISVLQVHANLETIKSRLTRFGYTWDDAPGGRLYSIRDDYETDLRSPTLVGRLAGLNRIAVLDDGLLVIGRAAEVVTNAVAARQGKLPSLADESVYQSAAAALTGPTVSDLGALVGVILVGEPFLADPFMLLDQSDEAAQEQFERYVENPLPLYLLAAFATYRAGETIHLTLALVFPSGVDAEEAAATLAARLQDYSSPISGRVLDEYWQYQSATGVEAGGLPVALVTMRLNQPEEDLPGAPFAWVDLVSRRDLLFLAPGTPLVR
ncbi:MAG: hypothetical protein DCC55_07925 [Chloroflexi bacterium]|nr:MAG: hypothetical protein DCC55_07925 [Chloroflexota bacterium]